MINTARQYIGINESQKNELVDYYNREVYPLIDNDRKYKIKYSDNWCAMFCSVIAHKIGLTKDQFPYEVSVYFMTRNAKKMGMFTTDLKKAQVNDLVVYDWYADGTLNHVIPLARTFYLLYQHTNTTSRPLYLHVIPMQQFDFARIDGTIRSCPVYRDWETDRKSTRLNSSHSAKSRMPSSA